MLVWMPWQWWERWKRWRRLSRKSIPAVLWWMHSYQAFPARSYMRLMMKMMLKIMMMITWLAKELVKVPWLPWLIGFSCAVLLTIKQSNLGRTSYKISIHIYQSRHALYTPKIVKYLLIYIYNTCRRRVVEINGVCLRQAGPNLTRHLKLIASKWNPGLA